MTDVDMGVNRAPSLSADHPQTSQLFDYGVHLASRTLFLFDEINRPSTARFLMGLQVLGGGGLTVKISTRGGCRASGLAVYDGMRECDGVRAVGYGEV